MTVITRAGLRDPVVVLWSQGDMEGEGDSVDLLQD